MYMTMMIAFIVDTLTVNATELVSAGGEQLTRKATFPWQPPLHTNV
jgi:hypothetical protein